MAAARFIRFFSRRQTKTPATPLNDENIHHTNSKFLPNLLNSNGLVFTFVFLDGEDVNFEVDVSYIE
jgi:penicillin-binding protein-related factor A (putative recombinase)